MNVNFIHFFPFNKFSIVNQEKSKVQMKKIEIGSCRVIGLTADAMWRQCQLFVYYVKKVL